MSGTVGEWLVVPDTQSGWGWRAKVNLGDQSQTYWRVTRWWAIRKARQVSARSIRRWSRAVEG